MVSNPESLDRMVSYFHALAREDFDYKGKIYKRYDRLLISRLIFRDYACPEGCGACCMKLTLDWPLEGTDRRPPEAAEPFLVDRDWVVNGKAIPARSDMMEDVEGRYCRYLNDQGRCDIYLDRPLPGRLELLKFFHFNTKVSQAKALVALPGRRHKYLRVDGERGAKCYFKPYSRELVDSHINELGILKEWMEIFEIDHNVDPLVEYLDTGPHEMDLAVYNTEGSEIPVVTNKPKTKGFFT